MLTSYPTDDGQRVFGRDGEDGTCKVVARKMNTMTTLHTVSRYSDLCYQLSGHFHDVILG